MERSFRPTGETFTEGAKTLPQKYFTSPEIFAKEAEYIFKSYWMCAGHEGQMPKEGNYISMDQGNENLLVVRGNTGQIKAFYSVCQHRGTRIKPDPEIKCLGAIQCQYHNWTYDLDGRLIGPPNLQKDKNVDMGKIRLKEAPVHLWNGFIFVNLNPGEATPFDKMYPEMPRLESWNLKKLTHHKSIRYDVAANWKYIIQNFNECYHCPTVHPQLAKLADYRSGSNDLTQGSALGGFLKFTNGESMTMTGKICALPLGDLRPEDQKRGYYYSILPNLLLNVHPDYVMYHLLTPTAADRTKIVSHWLFNPEASQRQGFNPEDAIDFWDLTNQQDWEFCELGQLGVQSQVYSPGPYVENESLLVAFDEHYLKIMSE